MERIFKFTYGYLVFCNQLLKKIRIAMSSGPPQVRNLLRKKITTDIIVGVTLGWVAAGAWWFGVARPRKQKYQTFYKNYDAIAEAEKYKPSFEE